MVSYFHPNRFLDVWLEIRVTLWNVILRAMGNVGPGKETRAVGEDSLAWQGTIFQDVGQGVCSSVVEW